MSEQTYAQRYQTFPADAIPAGGIDAAAVAGDSSKSHSPHFLMGAVLAACLVLWAAIGFVLWVPRVFSSMARFTFDHSRGMLSGLRPAEAGKNLRDAVSFYRRGFAVAIDTGFAKDAGEKSRGSDRPKRVRLEPRALAFDLMWTVVFWYMLLYGMGSVEASPVDGWVALIELPWADIWGAIEAYIVGGIVS